jgi:hypothetical protein
MNIINIAVTCLNFFSSWNICKLAKQQRPFVRVKRGICGTKGNNNDKEKSTSEEAWVGVEIFA